MKNKLFYLIAASMVFAWGCGAETTGPNTSEEERARCGAKCDSASSMRVVDGLQLVVEDGVYGLTSGATESIDEEVWVDILLDGDVEVYTEMYYDEENKTYSTRETFELSEGWEEMVMYAFGYVEGVQYEQVFRFAPGETTGAEDGVENNTMTADPFEGAYDVEAEVIEIPEDAEVPSYESAQVDGPLGLGGTEFWQKWADGLNPTYSYSDGTDAGRKCMYASARRFEAVMNDPPQSILDLVENSNWSGRFFNWNDDFSPENAQGSARGSVLWAWRTSLVKWISQTGTNGRCHLPTKSMVDRFAQAALAQAESEDGEIQGAQSN